MSFRIEVEELKKRTKCNRCGRTEHWARECRQPRDPTSSTSAANKSIGFKGKERGASYVAKTSEFHLVETAVPSELSELLFVAAVCNEPTMIQRLQASESQRYHAVSQDFFLVSSPKYHWCPYAGQVKEIWTKMDVPHPMPVTVCKFGNGHREVSGVTLVLPVGIGLAVVVAPSTQRWFKGRHLC
jgi:hypothetical protein